MATPRMLMLAVTFCYTGLMLTFWSGVYGTSIGRTKKFGEDAKSLVGLHGIVIGAGEIIGGKNFSKEVSCLKVFFLVMSNNVVNLYQ